MYEDSYLDTYWESRYDFGYDSLDIVFDTDVFEDGFDALDYTDEDYLDLDDDDWYRACEAITY